MMNKYVLLVICSTVLAGLPSEANLLLDPGFEAEMQYSPWICWDDVNLSSWAKRDGFQGIFLRDWNDYGDKPPHSGGFYQDVSVEPGKKYTFVIWARKEDLFSCDEILMSVDYFNVKYHPLHTEKTHVEKTITSKWKRYGLTSKSPPGAVIARVKISFSGGKNTKGSKRSCLFDDAVFRSK